MNGIDEMRHLTQELAKIEDETSEIKRILDGIADSRPTNMESEALVKWHEKMLPLLERLNDLQMRSIPLQQRLSLVLQESGVTFPSTLFEASSEAQAIEILGEHLRREGILQ